MFGHGKILHTLADIPLFGHRKILHTLADIPLSGHGKILHTLADIPLSGHGKILHTLVGMGSLQLLCLTQVRQPEFPTRNNEETKTKEDPSLCARSAGCRSELSTHAFY